VCAIPLTLAIAEPPSILPCRSTQAGLTLVRASARSFFYLASSFNLFASLTGPFPKCAPGFSSLVPVD